MGKVNGLAVGALVGVVAACSSSHSPSRTQGSSDPTRLSFRAVIEMLAPAGNPLTTPDAQVTRSGIAVLASRDASGHVIARYEVGPVLLDGTILASAKATQTAIGQWEIAITMTPQGAAAFDAMAAKEYHQLVAIVLDDNVESAPQINATNFYGAAQITGTFTANQAEGLARTLNGLARR